MKYTKNEYIAQYEKKQSQILPEFRKDYNIDNTYIYSKQFGDFKYKIDDVIDLLNFFHEFRQYVYNLKIGDKIRIYCYGNIDDVTITKISYKRGLNRKGEKIISSITCKQILNSGSEYRTKIKIQEVIYKDIQYRDIFDTGLHFYNYLFFGKYDVELADRIITKIRG